MVYYYLFMQTSSDYDHLMLMQKVEVFEQAIEHTSGDDLAKVLWLKSPSSEVSITGLYTVTFSMMVSLKVTMAASHILRFHPRCGLIVVLTILALWQSCPWLATFLVWVIGMTYLTNFNSLCTS